MTKREKCEYDLKARCFKIFKMSRILNCSKLAKLSRWLNSKNGIAQKWILPKNGYCPKMVIAQKWLLPKNNIQT